MKPPIIRNNLLQSAGTESNLNVRHSYENRSIIMSRYAFQYYVPLQRIMYISLY